MSQVTNIQGQMRSGPVQPDNYRVSLQEYEDRLKSISSIIDHRQAPPIQQAYAPTSQPISY